MNSVRKVTAEDVPGLAILFDAYRVFYEMDSNISAAEQFLTERISKQDSEIFVATDPRNNLIGFVQLYPLFSSTRMKRLWLLNDLYVESAQRGKGISKKLIYEAQQLCIDSNSCGLILETAKKNIIGNKLYPATGFQLDSNHNYYSWDC